MKNGIDSCRSVYLDHGAQEVMVDFESSKAPLALRCQKNVCFVLKDVPPISRVPCLTPVATKHETGEARERGRRTDLHGVFGTMDINSYTLYLCRIADRVHFVLWLVSTGRRIL